MENKAFSLMDKRNTVRHYQNGTVAIVHVSRGHTEVVFEVVV